MAESDEDVDTESVDTPDTKKCKECSEKTDESNQIMASRSSMKIFYENTCKMSARSHKLVTTRLRCQIDIQKLEVRDVQTHRQIGLRSRS